MILATALAAEGGVTAGMPIYAGKPFSSHELKSLMVGGFGYGTNIVGTRLGGFGIGFLDRSNPADLQGGFGGLIVGQEFFWGPVTIAVSSWTGLGGINSDAISNSVGFLSLYEELALELGFSPIPWLRLVAYGGYQLIASLSSGFFRTIVYNPVAGVRVVFG